VSGDEGESAVEAEDPVEGRPPASRRRFGCALASLALVLGGAGHWAYWYRPRAHALAPAASRLLPAAPALPVRLWLPYPHQNLGALGRAVGQPREVLAAAARLARLPEPAIPRLGAFGVPAASELLLATSSDGRQVVATLRLYPAAALATRLAGLLAGNPWLAGGEVRLDGRPAQVRWEGRTWRLAAGLPAAGSGRASQATPGRGRDDDSAPALALVELAVASPPLPAGRYVLRSEESDLVVRLGAALARPPAGGPPPRLILVWVERQPGRAEALLLMAAEREGLLAGFPGAAAWARPDGAMKVLPGGSILRQLTDVRPVPFAGGELAATERWAAAQARELERAWLPVASGASKPPLDLGGWLAIDPAAEQAERFHRLLEQVPILGAAEARRWGDVALVLRAAHGYRTLSCWLAEGGSQGELRLAR
jgi:hypothetical protein